MKKAPKIHKEDCCINWDGPAIQIHNFIRGLSPWPGAFTELLSPSGERFIMKVFRTKIEISRHGHPVRQILTDNKSILSVALNDGILYITELQLASKNKMTTAEFLKGFRLNDKWSVL
jgi:methionyl-tRNA formyltransferase